MISSDALPLFNESTQFSPLKIRKTSAMNEKRDISKRNTLKLLPSKHGNPLESIDSDKLSESSIDAAE